MTMSENIHVKLTQGLSPRHLEVVNESHNHNVPPGSESHFKVTAVSESFEGKSLLQRHRLIYGLLSAELSEKRIHALALHTFSPQEWEKAAASGNSPPCLNGSKK